jgi:L-fuconolactonase
MVIDAHHHFWRYSDEEYGWIPPDWSALRRDFLPADLGRELAAAGVDGVISVQARQSLAETEWLLDLAAQHEFIRGVVGWAPLVAPDLDTHLDRLAAHPAALAGKLRAFRHVLQGEPDDAYMLRDDFNRGIRALARRELAYDILVFERHLPNTITFVDRHPDQVFIVDHIAKPRIAAGELEPWAKNIRELARRPNVTCKLSGMVTEADVRKWTPGQLRPYFEIVLEAFGPGRLLFGSDWPVCLAGVGYPDWKTTVSAALSDLNPSELAAVFGENARRIYRLP